MIILKRKNFANNTEKLILLGKSKKGLRDTLTIHDPNSSDEDARKALNRKTLKRAAWVVPTLGAMGALYAKAKGKSSKKDLAKSALFYGAGLGGAFVGLDRMGLKVDRAMMKRKDNYPADTKRIMRQDDIRKVALGEMTKDEFNKKWK